MVSDHQASTGFGLFPQGRRLGAGCGPQATLDTVVARKATCVVATDADHLRFRLSHSAPAAPEAGHGLGGVAKVGNQIHAKADITR
jgi:hypothetical protein